MGACPCHAVLPVDAGGFESTSDPSSREEVVGRKIRAGGTADFVAAHLHGGATRSPGWGSTRCNGVDRIRPSGKDRIRRTTSLPTILASRPVGVPVKAAEKPWQRAARPGEAGEKPWQRAARPGEPRTPLTESEPEREPLAPPAPLHHVRTGPPALWAAGLASAPARVARPGDTPCGAEEPPAGCATPTNDEDDDLVPVRRVKTCPTTTTRPNFGGSWLCTGVEGDWDAFLKETGAPWGIRKAVASMGYGVGVQMQDITHFGDQLEVVNVIKCPRKETRAVYTIDGRPEHVLDIEGNPTVSTTFWDGDVLVTKQKLQRSLQPLPTSRRRMRGEQMCTERTTQKGLVVRRFYSRR